jgi:hypothetical protein
MPLDPLVLELLVKDGASASLERVRRETERVDDAARRADAGGLRGLGASLVKIGAAVGAAVVLKQVAGYLVEAGQAAAKAETSLAALQRTIGETADDLVRNLRVAARGTVADFELVAGANRALALGLDQNKLVDLMDVAAARSKVMGITVSQAFGDIVTGIGRQSPMILDNLGIVIDAEAAYKDYASTLGKTEDKLTGVERKAALLNQVLANSRDLVDAQRGGADSADESFQRLGADMENLKIEIGQELLPIFKEFVDTLLENKDDIVASLTAIGKAASLTLGAGSNVVEGFRGIGAGIRELAIVAKEREKVLSDRGATREQRQEIMGMSNAELLQRRANELMSEFGNLTFIPTDEAIEMLAENNAELSLLKELTKDIREEHDSYARSLHQTDDAIKDYVLTLDEAISLHQRGVIDVENLDTSIQNLYKQFTGFPQDYQLKFTLEELKTKLEAAKTPAEELVDAFTNLQNTLNVGDTRLDLLGNILEQTSRTGERNVAIDEGLAARLGFGSKGDLQDFLKEMDITSVDQKGEKLNVFGAQRAIELAKEDVKLRQEELTLANEIGELAKTEAEQRLSIALSHEKSVTSLKDEVTATQEMFSEVTTNGDNVVFILKQKADANERSADAAEREERALRAIIGLNDKLKGRGSGKR